MKFVVKTVEIQSVQDNVQVLVKSGIYPQSGAPAPTSIDNNILFSRMIVKVHFNR